MTHTCSDFMALACSALISIFIPIAHYNCTLSSKICTPGIEIAAGHRGLPAEKTKLPVENVLKCPRAALT